MKAVSSQHQSQRRKHFTHLFQSTNPIRFEAHVQIFARLRALVHMSLPSGGDAVLLLALCFAMFIWHLTSMYWSFHEIRFRLFWLLLLLRLWLRHSFFALPSF